MNANASVLVLEYPPTHFPHTPMGEFEHWRQASSRDSEHPPRRIKISCSGSCSASSRRAPSPHLAWARPDKGDTDEEAYAGMGCTPHMRSLGTSELETARRDAGLGFAAAHELPVLRTWSRSVQSYDDHPGWLSHRSNEGGDRTVRDLSSLDCRHWCAPGRTTFAMLDELAAQLLLESGHES